MTNKNNVATSTQSAPAIDFTSMTAAEKMAYLQQIAAAKYQPKVTEIPAETDEQRIKDATKTLAAGLTIARAFGALAVLETPENVDLEKTAKKLLDLWKKDVAAVSKSLQEKAANNVAFDLAELSGMVFDGSRVEWVLQELPPLYKGLIVAINFAELSDDAKLKFSSIGIGVEAPFAILTALSYDKSANGIFAKVAGFDLSKGSVRLTVRNVLPAGGGVNNPASEENFHAKIEELKAQIVPAGLKVSAKGFTYVSTKLAENRTRAEFALPVAVVAELTAVLADHANGAELDNPRAIAAIVAYLDGIAEQGK